MPNPQKSCENCEYRVTNQWDSPRFWHTCTCPATPWTFIKLTALCEHWEHDGDYAEIITEDTDET